MLAANPGKLLTQLCAWGDLYPVHTCGHHQHAILKTKQGCIALLQVCDHSGAWYMYIHMYKKKADIVSVVADRCIVY